MHRPSHVHEDAWPTVRADPHAKSFAQSVAGLFRVTNARKEKRNRTEYTVLYLKPTRSISDALLIEREILGLVAPYPDVQVRSVNAARHLVGQSDGRLDQSVGIMVHCDPTGDDRIRTWGREKGLMLVPICIPSGSSSPTPKALRKQIASEVFAGDPFQVTGPVSSEIDFFGRGNDALELLRQLRAGRIRAIFGIRKVGKTSLINRVVKLGRETGQTNFAVVDCSLNGFNQLDAEGALRGLAKVCKMGANSGYAHIGDALKRTDQELLPVFQDLWEKRVSDRPLVIVFDEVDYITPDSPTAPHWRHQFNDFWREFRVLVQEAQRHDLTVSVLVSGVSSRSFRTENIDGVENSVLHFVPEEYLSPFGRGASRAMIRDLEKRCGLRLTDGARDAVGDMCGDFPFWMRMAGSHIHRSVDVDARPVDLDLSKVREMLEDFLLTEGSDIARVAIENLERMYPEVTILLRECLEQGSLDAGSGRMLVRYGLATRSGTKVVVASDMVKEGIRALAAPETGRKTFNTAAQGSGPPEPLGLSTGEWAEELSIISRRRNELERKMRELIRFGLKLGLSRSDDWVEVLLKSVAGERRKTLGRLAPDALLSKLYWKELDNIIAKNWSLFESTFGDKRRFRLAMGLLNDRPDAHAKALDAADVALYRRELDWLEEKVSR